MPRSAALLVISSRPFSNHASVVNFFLSNLVAVPGSRFSPRSDEAAATSGPKHRHCNVHNGLTWNPCGPMASFADGLYPRPGGQLASALACRANGSRQELVRRLLAAPTSGIARRTARCCAGSRTTSWPVRRAPCQPPIALRSLVPSPSNPRPA